MKIMLGRHPGDRHVQASRLDRRYVFICPACKETTVEPHNRPQGRVVRCDACGQSCNPHIVEALPDQHGIWIGGNAECDPSSKPALIAAGYNCVGYCTKEKDAQVWYTQKMDPVIEAEVSAVIVATYGGEPVVYRKMELTKEEAKLLGMPPPEDEDEPPSDEETQDDEEDET